LRTVAGTHPDADSDPHGNAYFDTYTETYTNTKAAPDHTASPIAEG
jgi:hypothetical protein